MRSFRRAWTTVTLFCTTSPTPYFGAYRPCRMLQHVWSLTPVGVITSPLSFGNYIGCQYDREWNLSSLSLCTRRSTTWHHRICQTTASSSPPPGAVSYDHQTISSAPSPPPTHVWAIEHSLPLGHAFGTVFLHISVDLICRWTHSVEI